MNYVHSIMPGTSHTPEYSIGVSSFGKELELHKDHCGNEVSNFS